ncbi:DUF2924 domain-containing protein [Sphingomonas sp. LB-2]|uniref:DUF2924 domain-containing protein n=1 Tax=Sphingomonas caeni TaxID=2984949 RepID=UPI0022328528|nr:DUF2924 domain-containing protein [Sphingomonas caeni]MCW3847381.1 DUF2924 domain-containing protein [Sphingomonas caeni]
MASLEEEVEALATMSPAQLRSRWQVLTRGPVPKISDELLRLAVAYELQAKKMGDLSRDARRRLDQPGSGRRADIPTSPGTRLAREWQGAVHIVAIEEDGRILWNGRPWRSLSEVARAITGTRWSGPKFFGLKQKATA